MSARSRPPFRLATPANSTPRPTHRPEPAPAAPQPARAGPAPQAGTPYKAWRPRRTGDAAAFYAPASARAIASAMEGIVEQEGPIVLPLAIRRLAAAWGIDRVTTRVEARVAEILAAAEGTHAPRLIDGVLWPAAAEPETYRDFRTPADDPAAEREISEIPPHELANAMAAVLAAHVAMPVSDLAKESIRLLGFQRTTPKTQAAADAALDLLERQGRCERNADAVALPA